MAVTAPVLTSGVGTPLIMAVTAATAWLARSGGPAGAGPGPANFPQGGREGKTNAARIRAYRKVLKCLFKFFLYFSLLFILFIIVFMVTMMLMVAIH